MKSPEPPATDVAAYWEGNADPWADTVRAGRDGYREHFNNPAFLQFTGDLSGRSVLDAGCGEGYNTRILARGGARIVGVDIATRMIELARQEEKREPLGIRYEVASFSDLSLFEPASFDAVVSFMALMDGPDFEGAAVEILRVLRPGGQLVFSLTHPCFMTRGVGWIRDEHDSVTALKVSGYFDPDPYVEHWRFNGASPETAYHLAIPCFPRTLSQYINGLISAGFVIRQVQEPRPTVEKCREFPWLQRWRDHAAVFLYVRAAKPS